MPFSDGQTAIEELLTLNGLVRPDGTPFRDAVIPARGEIEIEVADRLTAMLNLPTVGSTSG